MDHSAGHPPTPPKHATTDSHAHMNHTPLGHVDHGDQGTMMHEAMAEKGPHAGHGSGADGVSAHPGQPNDAPALTRAGVGVAIASGTDVAVESAGIMLVQSNPLDVVKLIRLSRANYGKMIQNLWWAAGYNIVALPLAAGILAPVGVLPPPAVGAVLMSLSTIIEAINAQLLRRIDLTRLQNLQFGYKHPL